ncbi:hypothetical protein AYL99_01237 [Fonsecaea erecta]|uniref:Uncharacterized protein n=1 Tax=Fonsecaea erecta TaxID=1367422 RepID=A0A179A299_9EURO|nr:hypothetical protein AYL99_01237 [Fonsecaea erecta]OAP65265.1 hypothetical protein AYL99_01237 [Fonsecaea erecta]
MRLQYRSLPFYIRQDCLKLCLGSEIGFVIEVNNIVQDVMDSKDVLFIIFLDGPPSDDLTDRDEHTATDAVRIRVITPTSALQHSDVHTIPFLKDGHIYPPFSTLRKIRDDIAQHLHVSAVPPEEPIDAECNCALAELLVKRGEWEELPCEGYESCARCGRPVAHHSETEETDLCRSYVLRRLDLPCGHVIHSQCLNNGKEYECPGSCYVTTPCHPISSAYTWVVSGNGHIEKLELASSSHSALMGALADRLGAEFAHAEAVSCKGGLKENDVCIRLPIVAICANARHHSKGLILTPYKDTTSVELDLHTVEAPINASNLSLTLRGVWLAQIAVDGILTVYAVTRTAGLVLGLVLHNVNLNTAREQGGGVTEESSKPSMPYLTGYHTIDLRDVKTLEVVTEPVSTDMGLVNKGIFVAFSNSGLMQGSPSYSLTD